jgi:hypothetical protein
VVFASSMSKQKPSRNFDPAPKSRMVARGGRLISNAAAGLGGELLRYFSEQVVCYHRG